MCCHVRPYIERVQADIYITGAAPVGRCHAFSGRQRSNGRSHLLSFRISGFSSMDGMAVLFIFCDIYLVHPHFLG